jgi:hypothetical protein
MAPQTNQKSILEVVVDRGSKVHLPCNIQGNPLPVFTLVFYTFPPKEKNHILFVQEL